MHEWECSIRIICGTIALCFIAYHIIKCCMHCSKNEHEKEMKQLDYDLRLSWEKEIYELRKNDADKSTNDKITKLNEEIETIKSKQQNVDTYKQYLSLLLLKDGKKVEDINNNIDEIKKIYEFIKDKVQ